LGWTATSISATTTAFIRFTEPPKKGHDDRLKVQTAAALDAGGDFIKCSNNGCFWICIAAQNGQAGCLKTRELLLASRADPGDQVPRGSGKIDAKGTTALNIARRTQHAKCTRSLEASLA
jgi:ankyrin repeat protein